APVFGNYLSIAAGDLNGDKKPDLAIGNNAGGIRLLTNVLPVTITGVEPPAGMIKVYPNPARGYVKLLTSQAGTLNVLTINGSALLRDIPIYANREIELATSNWPAGLYFIELKSGENREVKKIVVQ